MSNAFAPIVRARPCPIFGRPVHPGFPPIDYSPILLLKPFGFQITPDTLSSSEISRWPARHYPRLWIQRPSSERRRDFNPPDSCAAQRTLRKLRPRSRPFPAVAASPVPSWADDPSSRVPILNLVSLGGELYPWRCGARVKESRSRAERLAAFNSGDTNA